MLAARFMPLARPAALARGAVRCLSQLASHEMRAEVSSAIHARPFEKMTIPSLVSSISVTQKSVVHVDNVRLPLESPTPGSHACYDREHAHLAELCGFFLVNPPPHGATFFSHALGGGAGGVHVRWERHSELATYTFHREANAADLARPFAADVVATASIPRDWLARIPGSIISAVHVVAFEHSGAGSPTGLDEAQFRDVKRLLNHYGHITGGCLHNHAFRAYTDWRCKADGFCHVVMYATERANRMALGKAVQRLVDLDKYRLMAMLALPLATQLSPRIERLTAELQGVMERVDRLSAEDSSLREQHELLHRLCELTADSLRLQALSSFRFSASQAYAKIVDDRLEQLGCVRIEGVPSLASFVQAATHPAMRTCQSVADRLHEHTRASQLTADLMRTSLTVRAQAQSAEQLAKIETTARTQLVLQESVEGLSAVAITYYTIGVLGYVAKSAAALGYLPAAPEVLLGAAVPVVGFAVWRGLHAMKVSVLSGSSAASAADHGGHGGRERQH
jgi:uncharacterized membrane-anchored protein